MNLRATASKGDAEKGEPGKAVAKSGAKQPAS